MVQGRGGRASATEDFDDGGDDELDLSASLWFQTLDKILSAKGAACRSSPTSSSASAAGASGRGRSAATATAAGELPQTAAVMGGVLDALLQRTLSSMAGESTKGSSGRFDRRKNSNVAVVVGSFRGRCVHMRGFVVRRWFSVGGGFCCCPHRRRCRRRLGCPSSCVLRVSLPFLATDVLL